MIRIVFLLIITLSFTISAQEEAGDYDRPSLTYIDRLLHVDPSVGNLGKEYQTHLVKRMEKELSLPRYDFNEIPRTLHQQFAKEVVQTERNCAGNRDSCLLGVTDLINRVIAPPVLEVVEMHQELRAQDRMSEQQKNSFIKDKAKELGFTEDEVKRVMNSAYIFMPFASDFDEKTWRDTVYHKDTLEIDGKIKIQINRKRIDMIIEKYRCKMNMGLVWWKILPGDSTRGSRLAGFEPLYSSNTQNVVTRTFTKRGSGYVEKRQLYKLGQKKVEAKHYARYVMTSSLGNGFGQRLRDFEDFKLSGQILERRGGFVGIDIGAREGIKIDDIFWIMENHEIKGETVQKKNGWVMVREVADSNSTEGYKSTAQVIGGRPYIGAVLKEKPMGSAKSTISFQALPYTVSAPAGDKGHLQGLTLNNGYGGRLELGGSIGRKIPQFYLMLGGGFTRGSASGRIVDWEMVPNDSTPENPNDSILQEFTIHKIDGVVAGHYDISLLKRFYIRRLALSLQTGFGYQHMKFDITAQPGRTLDTLSYHMGTDAWGGFSNATAEIAFSPGFAVGGGVGYRYFGKTRSINYTQKDNTDDEAKSRDVVFSDGQKITADAPEIDFNGMQWSVYMTFRPSISLRK